MLQDDWLAKMKICGQTERVWAAFVHARGAGDDVGRVEAEQIADKLSLWTQSVFWHYTLWFCLGMVSRR